MTFKEWHSHLVQSEFEATQTSYQTAAPLKELVKGKVFKGKPFLFKLHTNHQELQEV
jgi:hypothetical protein